MTKLKTLKDIDLMVVGDCKQQNDLEEALELIKIESIKWIKHTNKHMIMYFDNEDYVSKDLATICFIKHFFNITEDDLK